MCFNKEASLKSFGLGIFGSIALIVFGRKDLKSFNVAAGLLFMFLSLMQLIEFMIWSDIDCSTGLNKTAGIIGPILHNLQPVIVYIIALLIYKSVSISSYLYVPYLLNILYVCYFAYWYIGYLKEENFCSTVNEENHLTWVWKNAYFNYFMYNALFIIIGFLCFNTPLGIFTLILIYFMYFLVNLKYDKNSEIWCYAITGIPIILLGIESLTDIK